MLNEQIMAVIIKAESEGGGNHKLSIAKASLYKIVTDYTFF